MPRKRREIFENAFYHVYNRGVEKRTIFFDDADRQYFLRLLCIVSGEFRLEIFAYCLMGNHFHVFLKTCLPNLDKACHKLLCLYAKHINYKYNRVGYLFQGRYRSIHVDSDSYALQLIRYIHRNPVKDAFVQEPKDYAWSSFNDYQTDAGHPILNKKWVLSQFGENPAMARNMFNQFHGDNAILERETEIDLFFEPKQGRPSIRNSKKGAGYLLI